jgi:hypothetical protein
MLFHTSHLILLSMPAVFQPVNTQLIQFGRPTKSRVKLQRAALEEFQQSCMWNELTVVALLLRQTEAEN